MPSPLQRDIDWLNARFDEIEPPGSRVELEQLRATVDRMLETGAPDPAWTARHLEYEPGGYAREFRIAEGVDVDKIEASLRNGVLELRLPKTAHRRPRTIQVGAA